MASFPLRHFPQRSVQQAPGGAFARYVGRAFGTGGLARFWVYEALTFFLGNLSGAAGLALRRWAYRAIFGQLGAGVVIGRNCTVRHPSKIRVGAGTMIDDHVVLDAKSDTDPGIVIGQKCLIAREAKLSTGYTGSVVVGDGTIVGDHCVLHGPGGITVGRGVLLGDFCMLNAGLHVYAKADTPILEQGITVQGISVGDDVWMGGGVQVRDGVAIGRGAVIRAGSVVEADVPDYAIVAGNPAAVVGDRRRPGA